MCVLRAHCTSVAFRKDSRLKELSACQYINFNYKTILQKKKRTVCCTKLMNVRRQRVLVHILFCLDFCSIHLKNLLRDSVANSNLLSSWSDRCAGRSMEVNVFITLLSQKLSLTTCFFFLSLRRIRFPRHFVWLTNQCREYFYAAMAINKTQPASIPTPLVELSLPNPQLACLWLCWSP